MVEGMAMPMFEAFIRHSRIRTCHSLKFLLNPSDQEVTEMCLLPLSGAECYAFSVRLEASCIIKSP